MQGYLQNNYSLFTKIIAIIIYIICSNTVHETCNKSSSYCDNTFEQIYWKISLISLTIIIYNDQKQTFKEI